MLSVVMEIRLAIRRLIGEPGLTIPAVATMAIGIGIAASVFALADGVLLRPLPYPDPGRLVSIRHVAPGTELTRDRVSPGLFLHYRDGNRVFESLAGYDVASFTLTDGDMSERVRSAVVTPELFSLLEVVPRLGRVPAGSDDRWDYSTAASTQGTRGVMLGHDLWVRRYAADPDVVGRTIASLLYETSPTDPVTFAAVTLLLFGVALLASYIPARRASRIDPARALRAE